MFVIAWWGCGVAGSITQRIADAESHHPQLGVGGRWGRNPAKKLLRLDLMVSIDIQVNIKHNSYID